ncbi:MAG TPA: hypothetical protein ENG47_06400 [Candidatus Aerophobetes bacterium]|uniref:Calcineurin-like phosphoesterase domain-containing protein n=1 Tax=Aerophobetes bacterium TaxID=2030807 RepID=A0A7V0QRK9_UNCAE|nr:hypothetical protein [Candidatus Aerophobetes bacterium]
MGGEITLSEKVVFEGNPSLHFTGEIEKEKGGGPSLHRYFSEPKDLSNYTELRLWIYPDFEDDTYTLLISLASQAGKKVKRYCIGMISSENAPNRKWTQVSFNIQPIPREKVVKLVGLFAPNHLEVYHDGEKVSFYLGEIELIEPVIPPQEPLGNMLTNYSMERGETEAPVDWVFVAYHEKIKEAGWTDEVSHWGKKSIFIDSALDNPMPVPGVHLSGIGFFTTTYRISLEPGRTYCLQGYYNASKKCGVMVGGYPSQLNVEKREFVQSITNVSHHITNVIAEKTLPATGGRWKHFSLEFTPPPAPYPYLARVYLIGTYLPGKVYFDDVALTTQTFQPQSPGLPKIVVPGEEFHLKFIVSDVKGNPVKKIEDFRLWINNRKLQTKAVFNSKEKVWTLLSSVPFDFTPSGFASIKAEVTIKGSKQVFEKERYFYVIPPTKGTFSFVVIADTHLHDYPEQDERTQRFVEAIRSINSLSPYFALHVGDLRGISNGQNDIHGRWWNEVYQDMISRLETPLYPVPGNHDTDKTFLGGASTMYYYEKLAGYPPFYSFDVDKFHFVGIDTTVPGIAGRQHNGGFTHPGQEEWLQKDLQDAQSQGKYIILFFHHPPYEGEQFPHYEDRERLLDVIYRNRINLVLLGHNHHDWVVIKKNPYVQEGGSLPELRLGPLPEGASEDYRDGPIEREKIEPYYHNPAYTIFEQTTTTSGFLMRGSRYFGFRYIWVRDGKIVWDDTIPLGFKVRTLEKREGYRKIEVINPKIKSYKMLPLSFRMKPGKYRAYKLEEAKKSLNLYQINKGKITEVWVSLDIGAGEKVIVEIKKEN